MIRENTQYGKHENVTIVEFGTGDILQLKARRGDGVMNELLFIEQEAAPIGEETWEHEGKSTDEIKRPPVVLVFTHPASITTLIHTLVEMQQTMLTCPPPTF